MPPFAKRTGIMLAYPAEERRILAFPITDQEAKKRVFFHQPKLNGERARVEWFQNYPYLISSYGNQFKFLTLIEEEVIKLCGEFAGKLGESLGNYYRLDGEVYVHGWSREKIDGALRRTKNRNPLTDELEYHIFDIQSNKPQWERIRLLGEIEQAIQRLDLKHLRVVPYGTCNEDTWLTHCQCYCEESYEGIILRNPFGQYVEKRSPDLLKFKPTETDLYKIVGVNEAFDLEGQPKGMVGSFTVASHDEPGSGITFDVGAGKIPHLERIRLWNIREQLPGKDLLVKHELLRTTNSIPIAAVSVAVME